MISKADGDNTPLGQRSLCVLPLVYRIWASARLAHVQDWFYAWVLASAHGAGQGDSSVDAWFSTSIDIREILSNARHGDFHIFVADVVKSFDTVDRGVLGCALGRLRLPSTSLFIRKFVSVSSLLLVLELPGQGTGAFSNDASLVMVFIVVHYAPWCRYLETLKGTTPQLYADNPKCSSCNAVLLLASAQCTVP